MVTGSTTVSWGGITRPGPTVRATTKATGPTAASLAHQQPADRVAREAAGQHRPDRRGDHDGQQVRDGAGVQLGQLGPPGYRSFCASRIADQGGTAPSGERYGPSALHLVLTRLERKK